VLVAADPFPASKFNKDPFLRDWGNFEKRGRNRVELSSRRIFYEAECSLPANISKTRIFL